MINIHEHMSKKTLMEKKLQKGFAKKIAKEKSNRVYSLKSNQGKFV